MPRPRPLARARPIRPLGRFQGTRRVPSVEKQRAGYWTKVDFFSLWAGGALFARGSKVLASSRGCFCGPRGGSGGRCCCCCGVRGSLKPAGLPCPISSLVVVVVVGSVRLPGFSLHVVVVVVVAAAGTTAAKVTTWRPRRQEEPLTRSLVRPPVSRVRRAFEERFRAPLSRRRVGTRRAPLRDERRKAVTGARRCRAATGWERFRGCVTARWEVLCSPVQVSPKTADQQSGLRRARRDRGERALMCLQHAEARGLRRPLLAGRSTRNHGSEQENGSFRPA